MITLSTTKGAAVKVSTSMTSFQVFPQGALTGSWALLSHPEEEMKDKVISWPGEYDFQDVTLKAVGQQQGKQISYAAQIEGMRLGFVDAPVLEWSDADLDTLGDVDVLVIAADNQKRVASLVEAIDPRVVLLYEVPEADVEATAKACGTTTLEKVSEFKMKPGHLPTDTRQVVVLG